VTSTPSSDGSPTGGSFSSAITRRDRLRHLRPSDVLLGLQASLLFPLVALAVRRWGLRRVQERLAGWDSRPTATLGAGVAEEEARRLAWVVGVAAKRSPWRPNCLQRSVVLWWVLTRRGLDGDLRIGVRRRPGSPPGSRHLDFHAWVERDSVVLNDSPSVQEQFATFGRAIAPPDARWG
jgi:hypothetical protein